MRLLTIACFSIGLGLVGYVVGAWFDWKQTPQHVTVFDADRPVCTAAEHAANHC